MNFRFVDLFYLTLNRQEVPSYGQTFKKKFPQNIPILLFALCFINSALNLLVPIALEEIYSRISVSVDQTDYFYLISMVILAIGISQLLLIAYGMMLTLYKLNVKKSLSSRIIANNFTVYKNLMQSTNISQPDSMDLSVKVGNKLDMYVSNYYQNHLNLIFQSLNIVFIIIYLFNKLSFSLFFGLPIAGLVMYKTIKTAFRMTKIQFQNIALKVRRIKILEQFFTRVTEFKMCWLDKWIYKRIENIQRKYLNGLREFKLLDCWCVGLWQFSGVGISSFVITAYFLLGFNELVDKNSAFKPSTFIYLLGLLNQPLNGISWYITKRQTAMRAIDQLKSDVKLEDGIVSNRNTINKQGQSLIVRQGITLNLNHRLRNTQINNIKIVIPVQQLQTNKIYSIEGDLGQKFLSKLIFLFSQKIVKGYVEQDAWMSSSSLQTITMSNIEINRQQRDEIQRLMEIFQCHDIPLHNNTQNYSGGEKLRISLVRAFYLGEVIVINSNLNSLDVDMKKNVQKTLRRLVNNSYQSLHKRYTIFIRDNSEISDRIITFTEQRNNSFQLAFRSHSPKIPKNPKTIKISKQLSKCMDKALERAPQQIQNVQTSVSLSTFKIYYKSYKHIVFVVSILFITLLSNYYNYYVNTYINLAQYNQQQVITILFIALIFAVGLFFRTFYFADANSDQAERIKNKLNKNIIMDQLPFYQSQENINHNQAAVNSKSRLICALSSDTETIAETFPHQTNIFANNIGVIISSVIVILIQVPQIFIIIILLVGYASYLTKISHKKDEELKIALKRKEVEVYKIISDIEGGRKYLVVHNKLQIFTQIYVRLREEYMQIEWASEKYRSYINLKYKLVMILFLIVGVAIYSFVNIFTSQNQLSSNKSSGLALLIQYTMQLSNYLLYFTISILKIKGHAVSIERIRPYLEQKQSIRDRIQNSEEVITKIKRNTSAEFHRNYQNQLIEINNLTFAYQSNPQNYIFRNMSINVNQGDQIMIRGQSGSGKTTLYKLLTSTYPAIVSFIDSPFHISFSPQHPLVLPDTRTIIENLNPYRLHFQFDRINNIIERYAWNLQNSIQELTYNQKIVINNLRAYLHGKNGVIIYDEPQEVIIAQNKETYIIVAHDHQFPHNRQKQLRNGRLEEMIINN